jgi:geranylgeranyl diphosphate synthase type 3
MAEKYQDILSFLDQSSSQSESNEMVTTRTLTISVTILTIPQALMEPFSYITSNPGKDFRGGMMKAFNAWLHVPQPKLQIIGRVIAMLHNASLL